MEGLSGIVFRIIVVTFTVASTLLAGYSIQNKLRLRKIRLSWRAGKLGGYPLFATSFLGLISVLGIPVLWNGSGEWFWTLAAYLWIGCMWFISSYLASKYYITDYGIVKNINEPSQTIPWFQILDYVVREDGKSHIYRFNYAEMDKSLIQGYKQLSITVPRRRHKAFRKIVSLKLKNRFEGADIPDIDIKRIDKG